MKNIVLSISLFFISIISFCQTPNLVPNPGFEVYYGLTCTRGSLDEVVSWSHPNRWGGGNFNVGGGSTDHWHYDCPTFHPIPSHSGKGMIGGFIETDQSYLFGSDLVVEYATAELISPLESGKAYSFRFFIHAVTYPGDRVGIGFSMEKPTQSRNAQLMRNLGMTVSNLSIFYPADGWVEIRGAFIPDKNYKWITIGCFDEDFISFDTDQYYLWDDIRIWDYCPPELLIENHKFEFKEYPYEAGVIRAGYDVGAPTPNGPVIVKNGAEVVFKAETEVSLEPGFETEPGAIFTAYLAPCGRECDFLPVLNFQDDFEICNLQPVVLGMPTLPNDVDFYWTANPSSALQYLDVVNSSNPLFTPPANSCGKLTYTLTIYNSCNESISKDISIKYNTSSLQSTLQIQNLHQSNTQLSFDIITGLCTDNVRIEIFSSANNYSTAIYINHLPNGIDDNIFHFTTEGILHLFSPCHNYLIKVIATDICTGNELIEEIPWPRNPQIQLLQWSNVITANNDGLNDCLSFKVSGAQYYHVEVFSNNLGEIYNEFGLITNELFCTWHPEPFQYMDGPYFWTAEFGNSCNQSVFHNGSVTLFNSGNKNLQMETVLTSDTSIAPSLFFIHPNPFDNSFTITLSQTEDSETEIYLTNTFGRKVLQIYSGQLEKGQHAIEVSDASLPPGMYFCILQTPTQRKVLKVVKI